MVAELQEIAPAAKVGDCSHSTVGKGFKGGFEVAHYIEAAKKVSMPKGKTVREKESEFKWKMGPHDFEVKM
jgi:hypothetical protein